MKLIALKCLLIGGALCSAVPVIRAQDINRAPNYEVEAYASPWLTAANPAGLTRFGETNVSRVELDFAKSNGGLVNYYQSDDSYQLGVRAASLYRFSDKVVFDGRVGYGNFEGKHMAGSAFINPYEHAFDLVEADETNTGNKKLENYVLMGAVGVELLKGLSVGARFDFMASNYAKTKDLRHKNKQSDLAFDVGVAYQLGPRWQLGVSYLYQKQVEGLQFSMEGTNDLQYKTLVSYGGFYGKTELFGETGYTKKSEDKPMYNRYQGVNAQLSYRVNNRVELFAEGGFTAREGYYGNDSPTKVKYSNHHSSIYQAQVGLYITSAISQHRIGVSAQTESLTNHESVYRTETVDGVSTITYFDPLKVGEREERNLSLTYAGYWRKKGTQPLWSVDAAINQNYRKQLASVYPFYRKQEVTQYDFSAGAKRNFIRSNDMFTVLLNAGFHCGTGDKANDGVYATPSASQSEPQSMDSYLNKEYEYLTHRRYAIGAGAKYARMINRQVQGYVSVDYQLQLAPKVVYLSSDKHQTIRVGVGCIF